MAQTSLSSNKHERLEVLTRPSTRSLSTRCWGLYPDPPPFISSCFREPPDRPPHPHPSSIVCSVCHTGAKSSFHAIKQPERPPPQQPSVGEGEGNHSIKPDGERKRKKDKQAGKKTTPRKTESVSQKTNSLYFLFHEVKQILNQPACSGRSHQNSISTRLAAKPPRLHAVGE